MCISQNFRVDKKFLDRILYNVQKQYCKKYYDCYRDFSCLQKNFDDQIKKLLSLYWFYFFVFISGLIWIYLTGFAIYERDHLASFQRYMFYAIHPF